MLSEGTGQSSIELDGLSAIGVSVMFGLAINEALPDLRVPSLSADHHEHENWWRLAALLGVTALLLYSWARRGARAFVAEIFVGHRSH